MIHARLESGKVFLADRERIDALRVRLGRNHKIGVRLQRRRAGHVLQNALEHFEFLRALVFKIERKVAVRVLEREFRLAVVGNCSVLDSEPGR